MLNLASQEQAWLDSYRQALADSFPDLIEQIVIYGSKAREEAGPESDIDVLVILRRGDRTTKARVRQIGHLLAVTSEAVPSKWFIRWMHGRRVKREALLFTMRLRGMACG